MEHKFNTIKEALEDFRNGKFLIAVDDENRENEGDFIIAAEKITPEAVNFMLTEGRGLLCVPITEERCAELELEMQTSRNTSVYDTPFTVTVDKLGGNCTTGVSMYDRAETIKALASPDTKPVDLARPGHISPLRARTNGVLKRAGHTEATVDLARLAGLNPAGALIEIINPDGTMARLPQLIRIAARHNIKMISIKDLIAYRLENESLVERGETVNMPTVYGNFRLIPFRQKNGGLEHIALLKGDWETGEPVMVRMHSSCATGDIFGSLRCECGEQLHLSMKMIEKEGNGAVIYLNQEGRGIGLMEKIRAYKLQEEGLDTVDANIHLGYKPDEREYGVGAQILRAIGITKIKLITNNPVKRAALEGYGLEITENIPIEIPVNQYNKKYMETKRERMGHSLNF
ncbi:MAG: bifunctional 3,4-dihydroxy-2-butanone-4-phosphate synthase/GTP cyclohydrolase II [Dysgonamonadaceae bacterium]|nr:bifunctional 3,4-dihydroxy-2-butanone-4-phosphate synthase/GTP cyclohydrolase II [Dysgonamonadaceae bacterium]